MPDNEDDHCDKKNNDGELINEMHATQAKVARPGWIFFSKKINEKIIQLEQLFPRISLVLF